MDENLLSYKNKKKRYNENFKLLLTEYKKYKHFVYNGSEVKCIELNNYYIDNSKEKEIKIEFIESFNGEPEVFLSINGFYYNPISA